MRNILKNRRALSTVVTTLIILVVSVLLAGVVTYYAINVTSTRVTQESLLVTDLHVWEDSGGASSQAAFVIMNTGGRDVDINKIQIRGQTADWTTQVYSSAPGSAPTGDLAWCADSFAKAYFGTTASTTSLVGATGDLTLPSGKTIIVYISSPDSVTINDIGLTVGITVFTSQAMYYEEANVEAYVAPA
jgi:hypothetical protein